jgi:hypothetical protein
MFIINAGETTDWKDVEDPIQQQRINPKTTTAGNLPAVSDKK